MPLAVLDGVGNVGLKVGNRVMDPELVPKDKLSVGFEPVSVLFVADFVIEPLTDLDGDTVLVGVVAFRSFVEDTVGVLLVFVTVKEGTDSVKFRLSEKEPTVPDITSVNVSPLLDVDRVVEVVASFV